MTATPPPPTTPRPPRANAILVLCALNLLTLAGLAALIATRLAPELRGELAATRARLERVEEQLRLARLEARSTGQGPAALIEQIAHWAPDLQSSATPEPQLREIRARLDDILEAVGALGPDAFDAFVARLATGATAGDQQLDDETRKWILKAAVRADRARGLPLLAEVVRGNRFAPSARLRFFAADELRELDRELAGQALRQVLQVESAAGLTRQPPPGLAPEYERHIGTERFPEFYNLIYRYVACGDPDCAATLQMILGRAEHDRLTYQECIRHLGQLRCRDAVPRIQELYHELPRREFAPLFQTTCLQAVADILGAEACPWLQDELRNADVEIVANKLRELIKQLCS
ncbi:MAG: hypothetical protein IPM29_11410 [Planctomycetes bacterium]|nr:hypothetical protein [Planctomycetota bacterium]